MKIRGHVSWSRAAGMGPVGIEPTISTYPMQDCKGGVICGRCPGRPLDHGP